MVVYHLHFVKSENGLWFYSLDLLKFISMNLKKKILVICSEWQVAMMEKLGLTYRQIDSFLNFLGISWEFKNHMQICPTLRPVFGLKTITIVHDFWPVMQKNLRKRTMAKILFFLARCLSNVYYISCYHAQVYGSKNILPNRLDFSEYDTFLKNDKSIFCDVLLIGTETERKNLELLPQLIEQAFSNSKTLDIVIVGTGIEQILPFEYRLYNLSSL